MLGAPHFAIEMMPKSQRLQGRTIEKRKNGDYKKDGHKLQKVGVMRLRAKTKKNDIKRQYSCHIRIKMRLHVKIGEQFPRSNYE